MIGDGAATVSREFDVDEPRATVDLLALANDLLARGLLEVVPDAAR
jgi:sulfur transfer complex TusBCD TusB component (DsrH family)